MSSLRGVDSAAFTANADEAAACLRVLSNPSRLLIVCKLMDGEMSVGELESDLGMSQAYVSQQLARLRSEGYVVARRDGRAVHYSMSDTRVRPIVQVVYDQFCAT